ncbi:MAG: sel1 repeat family protein [Alphaproteobacteria bacterium]|nr:sel1 repeat family protein [Alphaproteobacteria bacterium]
MISKIKRFVALIAVAAVIALPTSYFLIPHGERPSLKIQHPSKTSKLSYLERLESKALAGDANAMFRMGNNYKYGYNGLKPDNTKAIEWYEKAISHGDADAMNNLGVMYKAGEDIEQDYSKAIELFEKATVLKNGKAFSNLGSMYQDGKGVPKDYKKARELYLEGVEVGNTYSMANLGFLYYFGNGVEKDPDEAQAWFLKAAESGETMPGLQFMIGLYYFDGHGNQKQDLMQARLWFEKAAKQGHADAQSFLGNFYYYGQAGLSVDYIKAGEYYEISAQNGNAYSKEFLDKVIKNCNLYRYKILSLKANISCLVAAPSGDPQAMYITGLSFYFGTRGLLDKDYERAAEWLQKSAKAGNVWGQIKIAKMYNEGLGLKEDPIEAYAWLSVVENQKNIADALKKTKADIRDNIYKNFNQSEKKKADLKAQKYIELYLAKEN